MRSSLSPRAAGSSLATPPVAAIAAALALCCALAGVLFLGASPALALQTRVQSGSFGAASSSTPDPSPLLDPQGVAVDQSNGDVYVADTGNSRVEKFDALGNLLVVFGADVGGAGVDTCTSFCAAGTQGSEPGQFTTAEFVAVDNDPASPSYHDVYVGDTGDNLVSKFSSAGVLEATWGNNGTGGAANGQLNGSGTTPFGEIAGIAVDAGGDLVVLNTSSKAFKFTQAGGFTEEFSVERLTAEKGLAVNSAGNLFKVNGDGSVEELTPSGGDVGTVTPDPEVGTPPHVNAIAVEPASGDLYTATEARTLDHYQFNGSGQVVEPGGSPCTLAFHKGCAATDSSGVPFAASGIAVVSGSGDTYLANPGAGEVDRYTPPVTVPDVTSAPASEVGPTSATFNGSVNPVGLPVTDCHFEYIADTAYKAAVEASAADPYAAGQTIACTQTPAQIGSGTGAVAVSAHVSGLTEGVAYDYRLDASNANGPDDLSADQVLTTATPPALSDEVARELTATGAELTAKIAPDNGATTYQFEYGTNTAYGTKVPVPAEGIGSGAGEVSVSRQISGLEANTTYHWRLTATNTAGTSTGTDHTFVYTTSGEALPDNRAYEMVTPPQKNGALIGDVVTESPAIAANGSRVIAKSIQCFAGATSCQAKTGIGLGSPYEFSRTATGWVTTPLAPPVTQLPLSVPWAYDVDTGTALFSASTPPFGEDDFYRREASGELVHIGPNSPPEDGPRGTIGGPPNATIEAETADFSHFVWDTGGAGSAHNHFRFDATEEESTVYEYVGAGNTQPLLVGVSGGQGSDDLISRCQTELGQVANSTLQGTLSADGRTVYFTALPCEGGSGANEHTSVPAAALYARIDGELPDAHTVAISQRSTDECTSAPCETSPPSGASFQGASEDGSMAFFTDTQQLTDNASEDNQGEDHARGGGCSQTNGPNGCNLYLYDFANPTGHELVDVSAGDTSGLGPEVQGVVAISADGSHVYFVANGVLAPGAEPGTCHEASGEGSGQCNLYVYERDPAHPDGRTTFIATLPASDLTEWNTQPGHPANVTPDGEYLVFVSHGDLTGDDTSRSGAQQVFEYDAATGTLTRISIGNDGFDDDGNRPAATPCNVREECSEEAQIVPGEATADSSRLDPSMSDNGRFVFFQSPVGLTPGALDDVRIGTTTAPNGTEARPAYAQNVYEWHEGHVYLISDGRDVSVNAGRSRIGCGLSSVCLLGADTSGANVFFATADRLVPQDVDTEVDFYDAHICSAAFYEERGLETQQCIAPPAALTPPCLGEVCHGTPAATPPVPGAPSVTFNGQGNLAGGRAPHPVKPKALTKAQKLANALKVCKKDRKKVKRKTCEAAAHKKYGAVIVNTNAKGKKKHAKGK